MGSKEIHNVKYRQSFAFIGQMEIFSGSEAIVSDLTEPVSVIEIFNIKNQQENAIKKAEIQKMKVKNDQTLKDLVQKLEAEKNEIDFGKIFKEIENKDTKQPKNGNLTKEQL